ncbi:uncharacterized protein LOC118439154 [Folsomia candida]|uniref:uncharacterized protein LOC118439154 n=1 Tax=Folsomia candida TaxID=158441 RepID=UPI001604D8EB|nr:uncharacterized protein LOC118439154 [Folsomia candida]
MAQITKHLLTKEVQQNLIQIKDVQKLSLIKNMDLVKKSYTNATGKELTKEEFLHSARIMSPFVTELDVDIIFSVCDSPNQNSRAKQYDHEIRPEDYFKHVKKIFTDLNAL